MSPHTHRRPAARLTAAFVLLAASGLAGCSTLDSTFGLASNSGYDPNLSTASIPGSPSVQSGVAAWDGDVSAPGMTAAHPTLMNGSWARVTNAHTGQSAVVQVTRRLEGAHDRDIELSRDAAIAVGALHEGFATVLIEPIDPRQASPAEKQALAPVPSPRQPAVVETAMRQSAPYQGYDPNLATASTPRQGVAYEPLPPATPRAAPQPAAVAAPRPQPLPLPTATSTRYLQIGSFRDPKYAQTALSTMKAQGLADGAYGDAFIQTAYVDGQLYHRVRLGPIDGEQLAARALADARGKGHAAARLLKP